jgi:hypothetical protein
VTGQSGIGETRGGFTPAGSVALDVLVDLQVALAGPGGIARTG